MTVSVSSPRPPNSSHPFIRCLPFLVKQNTVLRNHRSCGSLMYELRQELQSVSEEHKQCRVLDREKEIEGLKQALRAASEENAHCTGLKGTKEGERVCGKRRERERKGEREGGEKCGFRILVTCMKCRIYSGTCASQVGCQVCL